MVREELIEKTLYVLMYHTEEKERPDEYRFSYLYAKDAEEARLIADERIRSWGGPVQEIALQACPDGFILRRDLAGKRWLRPDEILG